MEETGVELWKEIIRAFWLTGTHMSAWCRENQVNRRVARSAVLGERNGPKAKALRATLCEASEVERAREYWKERAAKS